MTRWRWTQELRSLGVAFWLLLPLLGIGFWFGSGILTDRMLSRSSKPTLGLVGDRQLKKQPPKTVQSIIVAIDQRQGVSNVKIETANSALKELTFEFPTTEPAQIEAAISQELGLPSDRIRQLTRYQLQQR